MVPTASLLLTGKAAVAARTASAARRPDFSAPSSVAVSRWSPHTKRPLVRFTALLKSVGGACIESSFSGHKAAFPLHLGQLALCG